MMEADMRITLRFLRKLHGLKERVVHGRSTIVVPYSSTESINTIPLRPDGEKESLLFFR